MFLLHLCPGLHAITNFTVLCRFATKNRGRNDFSHFTIFRYFFVFPTYQTALPNSTNSAKLRKSGPQRLFLLYYFSLLFGLSHLPEGLPNSTNSAKMAKNRGRNDFSSLFCFSHLPEGASEFNKFCENIEKSWSQRFFALCCFHLPERASELNSFPEKCEKSCRFPTLLFFLRPSSLRRTADVKLIALV